MKNASSKEERYANQIYLAQGFSEIAPIGKSAWLYMIMY